MKKRKTFKEKFTKNILQLLCEQLLEILYFLELIFFFNSCEQI